MHGMHGMRLRSLSLVAVLVAASLLGARRAGAQATDPMANGLTPGDYVRIGGGYVTPVNSSGSLRDWTSGVGASLMWENWQQGSGGMGRVGFGLGVGYNWLPLDEAQFKRNFTPPSGGAVASATASKATILEITSEVRFRIPAPLIMPTINVGLGFMNWAPGEIQYQTTGATSSSARQQHRSGAEVSIGGGVDEHLFDRYAVFAEAMYTYGFTSVGSGFAAPSSTCAPSTCDITRNTSIGTVRGGLRVRLGR
jgi:hypothetical protein